MTKPIQQNIFSKKGFINVTTAGYFLCWVIFLGLGWESAQATEKTREDPPPEFAHEAPRLRSIMEHGWAAEKGIGQAANSALAASLYCEAARFSSAEAHYRAGLVYASASIVETATAAAFFKFAMELGHEQVHMALNALYLSAGPQKSIVPSCLTDDEEQSGVARRMAIPVKFPLFNFQGYLAAMPEGKRAVAALLVKHAPLFGVNTQLALAIASVESNFEVLATSPKNAKGVMQLIPATASRFGVKNSYDAEDNIRGGLAYLRWLGEYFHGDLSRVIAAYNAGEGAVNKYNGIPPYPETIAYVKRVLTLSRMRDTGANTMLP